MRLFIAIELPKSFLKEVLRLQEALRAQSQGGRFVPRGNFHHTLHFIGESRDLAGAAEAMGEAVRGIRPFGLHLGEMGAFPHREGHTVFLHGQGQLSELNALYESLQSALLERGFPRAQKAFTPHITLARGVALPEGGLAALSYAPANASMLVQSITLFESQRQGRDMVYLPLHRERF